jgi:hypothetical protein
MLEKGTSMENLMLWSSWTTRLDTILKLGFFFPPGARENKLKIVFFTTQSQKVVNTL